MAKRKKGCIYGFFNSISVLFCLAFIIFIFVYIFNTDTFYRNRYPLLHSEIIEEYCALYNVDKYLVHSIIRTESFYDENAVSSKGALGLMQIMPDTGAWIAEKLNLENFTKEDLFDSEKNIMMGVWYIGYLSDRFNGNFDNMIAAYNAGPTNVSKWLAEKTLSSDGENLTDIPFEETKKYKEKVSNAYEMYLKIYSNV